jgi:hypothetical protein
MTSSVLELATFQLVESALTTTLQRALRQFVADWSLLHSRLFLRPFPLFPALYLPAHPPGRCVNSLPVAGEHSPSTSLFAAPCRSFLNAVHSLLQRTTWEHDAMRSCHVFLFRTRKYPHNRGPSGQIPVLLIVTTEEKKLRKNAWHVAELTSGARDVIAFALLHAPPYCISFLVTECWSLPVPFLSCFRGLSDLNFSLVLSVPPG